MSELTQARVRELFAYNPRTGAFWRIKRVCNNCKLHFSNWSGTKDGYQKLEIDGKCYRLHRVIWLFLYGSFPDQIDHINGNRLDNRPHNLRDVSHAENHKNKSIPSNNTSGVVGVRQRTNRWEAVITTNHKIIYLGLFVSFNAAVTARKQAEKKYGFHPGHGKAVVNQGRTT